MSRLGSAPRRPLQHAPRGRIWANDGRRATTATEANVATATFTAREESQPRFPSLRSLFFGSFYIYSPRGRGAVCEVSRRICVRLKLADPTWLAHYARCVREELTRHEILVGLFDRETCFVPVPGSTLHSGSVWAAERLATALHGAGLGKAVWTGLYRTHAVRKSATALSGHRPTVRQHYESLAVAYSYVPPSRILLVDDVITRGRTILAAALRLHEALPNADIRAFALVRTMGLLPDVTHFLEPCQGVIYWAGGDTRREP